MLKRKRRTREPITEHAMTALEIVDSILREEAEKRRRNRKRVPLRFSPVTTGRITLKKAGRRAVLDYPRGDVTMHYFFLRFVTPKVLDALIFEHWEVHDRTNKNRISHQDLLEMMAVRTYLHTQPKKRYHQCWPLPEPFKMGRARYERLSKVVFRKRADLILCVNYSKMITQFPDLIIIDEKHKGLKSPCEYQQFVRSKPTPLGHWIMEVCIRLPVTGRPFLFQSYRKEEEEMTLLKYACIVRHPYCTLSPSLIRLVISHIEC